MKDHRIIHCLDPSQKWIVLRTLIIRRGIMVVGSRRFWGLTAKAQFRYQSEAHTPKPNNKSTSNSESTPITTLVAHHPNQNNTMNINNQNKINRTISPHNKNLIVPQEPYSTICSFWAWNRKLIRTSSLSISLSNYPVENIVMFWVNKNSRKKSTNLQQASNCFELLFRTNNPEIIT